MRPWWKATRKQENTVIRAYRAGATLKQAGRRAGLCATTARRILRDRGVTVRPHLPPLTLPRTFTRRQRQSMKAMYERGYTLKMLAVHFASSYQVVSRELRALGVRIRWSTQISLNEERRIAKLYRAGHSMDEIFNILGRFSITVRRALQRQGVVTRPPGRRRGYSRDMSPDQPTSGPGRPILHKRPR